jgi:low affinity Fe/Cu permease
MRKNNLNIFEGAASASTRLIGSFLALGSALAVTLILAFATPLYDHSDTWQLIINAGITLCTFLMVFIIQNRQTNDAKAMHLQMNADIAEGSWASRPIVDIERLSDTELDQLHNFYHKLRDPAASTLDTDPSSSIEAEVILKHEKSLRREELRRTNRTLNSTNYEK